MLRTESTAAIEVGVASPDGSLAGWEQALGEIREQVVPALVQGVLGRLEEALVTEGCGLRRAPDRRVAPFECPRCGAHAGFRRRGRRDRTVLSRLGRIVLSVQMVGCGCGHRFAPLLAALGIAPHRRVAPGLERRALEPCSELPYRRAAAQLRRESGAAPSPRSLGRLVRRAAQSLGLLRPRPALRDLEAVLIDETRVRAGPPKGRDDRGRELQIAVALRRHGPARIELLGAALARGWAALAPSLRTGRGAAIAVTDGDQGPRALVAAVLPEVPHQVCTFQVRRSLDHRLWQDHVRFERRRSLAQAIGNATQFARSAAAAESAVGSALNVAERHGWRHTAAHLRELAPDVATWLRVDPSGALTHTTSLLERTMREVNRRVDPVGVRWSLRGAEAIVSVLLARRFSHPRWRQLCHDRGRTRAWARIE